MKQSLLLFPNQLFYRALSLDVYHSVFLVEHPKFFTEFTYHVQKLILHRASMKAFAKAHSNANIVYIDHQNFDWQDITAQLDKDDVKQLQYYDLVDHELEAQMQKHFNKIELVEHRSPGFILGKEEVEKYAPKQGDWLMARYYKQVRTDKNILMDNGQPKGGKWSFDASNRKPLPKDIAVPSLPKLSENKFVREAKQYVAAHCKNAIGTAEAFNYPVTVEQAGMWFGNFLQYRFSDFGPYEDAIDTREVFLFHSVLSPLLNIGLLKPDEVIDRAITYAEENNVSIESLEGFVRQILGWREFMRMVYHMKGRELIERNYFDHDREMPKSFWTGKTGLTPFDSLVKNLQQYAYSHHIERLMVAGSLMLMVGIQPQAVYEWFMCFYIDAYEWVMVPNVISMTQYADGGLVMTKPYVSGSNYLRKMGNYEKGDWVEIWDALYWHFLGSHKYQLSSNHRMTLMLNLWDKKSADQKEEYSTTVAEFLAGLQ